MDELRNLWSFVQVVQAGGFSAAATELGLSPAALSKGVARLENRLGLRLLARNSRSVQLTQHGLELFERVAPSYADIRDSLQQLREKDAAPSGLVRLSVVTAYGRRVLLPILPDLMRRYPQIDLQISFHDGRRGFDRKAFDVRITWGEDLEPDKVAKPLGAIPVMLAASRGYIEHRGTPKTPQDLAHHDCIAVLLPDGTRAGWRLRRRSGRRAVSLTVQPRGRLLFMDELDVVEDAVAAGLGIAAVDASLERSETARGTFVRVLPDYELLAAAPNVTNLVIQYPQRRYATPRVRVVVDYLIEKLGAGLVSLT